MAAWADSTNTSQKQVHDINSQSTFDLQAKDYIDAINGQKLPLVATSSKVLIKTNPTAYRQCAATLINRVEATWMSSTKLMTDGPQDKVTCTP